MHGHIVLSCIRKIPPPWLPVHVTQCPSLGNAFSGSTHVDTNRPKRTLPCMQLPARITALACKGDLTFAAVGRGITVCKRVHLTHSWKEGHQAAVIELMVMGDYLLSLSKSGELCMWSIVALSPTPVVRFPSLQSFGFYTLQTPASLDTQSIFNNFNGLHALFNVMDHDDFL
jgi:hypothetical protein